MELKIRETLNSKSRIAPAIVSTLVQLKKWAASLHVDGTHASRIAAKVEHWCGAELVENIAESLIESATGIERKLLSKSLQEALFYCSGFDAELDYQRFKGRIERHL